MPATLKTAITFSEKKELEASQLLKLFHQAPWAKDRTLEDAKEMLRHTDVALCAWDGDQLIGFGRVLTDFIVSGHDLGCHRGQGLSKTRARNGNRATHLEPSSPQTS